MNIGLFVNAASAAIPATTNLVTTSGYSTSGVGAASYAYDPTVTQQTVTTSPTAEFLNGGRGFRLAEAKVTPQMMGGNPDTSNYNQMRAALQQMVNFSITFNRTAYVPAHPTHYRIDLPFTLKSRLVMELDGIIENVRPENETVHDQGCVYFGHYHPAYTSNLWNGGAIAPRWRITNGATANVVQVHANDAAEALATLVPNKRVFIGSNRGYENHIHAPNTILLMRHYFLWARITATNPATGEITLDEPVEFFGNGVIGNANNIGTFNNNNTQPVTEQPMYLLEDATITGTGGFESKGASIARTACRNVSVHLGSNKGLYGMGGNAVGDSDFYFENITALNKLWDVAAQSYRSTFGFGTATLLMTEPPTGNDQAEKSKGASSIGENSRQITITGGTIDATAFTGDTGLLHFNVCRGSSMAFLTVNVPNASGAMISVGSAVDYWVGTVRPNINDNSFRCVDLQARPGAGVGDVSFLHVSDLRSDGTTATDLKRFSLLGGTFRGQATKQSLLRGQDHLIGPDVRIESNGVNVDNAGSYATFDRCHIAGGITFTDGALQSQSTIINVTTD